VCYAYAVQAVPLDIVVSVAPFIGSPRGRCLRFCFLRRLPPFLLPVPSRAEPNTALQRHWMLANTAIVASRLPGRLGLVWRRVYFRPVP